MSLSKHNPTALTTVGLGRFSVDYINVCEVDRLLHFSVTVAHLTGWPVHVVAVGREVLRLHAGDSGGRVFDVRGIFPSLKYDLRIIEPLARARKVWPESAIEGGQLRVATHCCGEEGLSEFGLSVDGLALLEHQSVIRKNKTYLSLIPIRPRPHMPATILSKYSWSGCTTYAEALSRVSGLTAATMIPTALMPEVTLGKSGFHSVVLHPDGQVEDVWGKQDASKVAQRYGMARWTFSEESHKRMVADALQIRSDTETDIQSAIETICAYRER